MQSVIHYDLLLEEGEIFARLVEVAESPPNPVLRVDFSEVRATAQRPLILTEHHISVKDIDTLNPLDPTKVDASKIKFRITNIQNGTLKRLTGAPSAWVNIVGAQEFTLAQLQGGLIAFSPDAAGTLTFDIQAADDGLATIRGALRTSATPTESDADPTSVSVSVVGLETVVAGKEARINEDGVLTPHDDTLDAWLAADDTLRIFVVLEGGKEGIITPAVGVVQERLSVGSSHGVEDGKIAVSWEANVNHWRLSLQGSTRATRADFQAMLNSLQLQTVHFGQVSHRTILVQPDMSDMSVPIARAGYYLREVEVGASLPNPILEVAFEKTRLDSGQRFVLTQEHILVYDPDTTDASSVWLRVTGLTGGELQSRPASDSDTWTEIPLSGPGESQYRKFTLADLRAGKIAFLAGDGVAKIDGGKGKKIVFQVQAADAAGDAANLSDSDPNDGESDADPVDVQVLIVSSAAVIAGEVALINADEVLTPDPAILNAWKQEAESAPHRGTLGVVVRLLDMLDKQTGDVLSLRSGYNESNITPRWDGSKGELSLEIGRGTTTEEIRAALALLELHTEVAGSASTRRVWVFPVLSGVGNFGYRVDETAGLVRYYLHDGTGRSFSAASTAASGRILFGKQGYLGVPLSNAGKSIYAGLRKGGNDIRLALTDTETEGKWVITAGPRKGQLFWDHTTKKYGPGAQGSDWTSQGHFWDSGEPDGGNRDDYARLGYGGRISDYRDRNYWHSISHHDLLSSDGFVRLVEVRKSPPNPLLSVDFSEVRATAQRPLILTEHHISVKDVDTLDPLDTTKMDASKIKFRITNIAHGTLKRLTGAPSTWENIVGAQEFSLADLQGGLIAFFPDAGASTFTFDIQAADDGLPNTPGSPPHLSDSDRSTSDPDPESVSVPVVVLEKVVVGEEVRINEDGVLTPNDVTLDEWLAADDTLQIFVVLQGGKSGIFTPSAGVVHEHLSVASSHGVASSKIAVSWDADDWRLSLTGTGNATRLDFQKVLGALQLQTVPFGQVSHRTISVQPDTSDMSVPVARAGYYLRAVEVSASAPNPILELDFDKSRLDSGQRFVLTEEHILVYDPDTHDASSVWLRVTGLTGGELQRRSGSDWTKIVVVSPKAYLEFTLAELRAGRIAFLAGDGLASGEGKKIVFQVQAADAPDNNANLSDSDPNDGESDADPVDAEIPVVSRAKATAGFRGLLNADEALSPNEATLGVWKQEAKTHSGTLHVVVRLENKQKQKGDVLSLQSGYDASKITPLGWDAGRGELSLKIDDSATEADIRAALKLMEFESALSNSASTRKVWVFPTLSGVGSLRYRFDASAGLVRYYFYDSTRQWFSDASTAASGRTLFGKHGYLGVPTSSPEKSIYKGILPKFRSIFLAVSDDPSTGTTEGKWVITAGPRKGQLFWDHTERKYGPGAAGSGWTERSDFWTTTPSGGTRENYARMRGISIEDDRNSSSVGSISHHDLRLAEGEIFVRLVEVAESPPNPVLRVDFDRSQATARRPLILTEDHISVEDPDTLLSDGRIDPDKITFRVMGMTDGTLQLRPDRGSDTWTRIDPSGTAGNQYLEFTLPQLRDGRVSFFPNAGISRLTFRIQAADDGLPGTPGSLPHLSDADPYDRENDVDPTSVSIPVVALKEIEAGQKGAFNDDNPRGALTPDADTLQAWLTARTPLQIFVVLQGGKSGIAVPEEGVVEESLSLSGSVPNIAAIWDGHILSLLGDSSTTVADFEAALGALQLQTVRLKEDSYRTISVRPDITGDVPKKDFYVREVKIGASPKEPLLGVRGFERISITAERYLVLDESHILVDDVDTRDSVDSTKVDANKIKFRITNIPDSILQKRASVLDSWIAMTKEISQDYYAFTLTELREGLVSLLPDASVPTLTFEIQAGDGTHFSDSDRNDNQNDADPASVSIRVVALKKIDAGKEMPVSDESGDGALTPSGATLGTWIGAATSSRLRVLVTLHNGRFGEELFLQDGHGIGTITSSWSWDADTSTVTLSLQSNGSATTDDFQAVLNALALRTVRSASASVRTISVRPDVVAPKSRKRTTTRGMSWFRKVVRDLM